MRTVRVRRTIDASAATCWALLTTTARWPEWGPSVRAATLDGEAFDVGATGHVTTTVGPTLPFEITVVDEGRRWAWRVGGITATDHTVEPLGPHRCEVTFGVPWPAWPYLLVCLLALRRLDRIATRERMSQ